jgi:hypothetical protein
MTPPVHSLSSFVSSVIELEITSAPWDASALQAAGMWTGMICGVQSGLPGTHALHPFASSLQPNSHTTTS